jgi:hypothetical protein
MKMDHVGSPKQPNEGLSREDLTLGAVGLAGAGMLGAELLGFAAYTAPVVALNAVSGAVGVTLPFAAYMGLTSALGVVVGPVGWTILGTVGLVALGSKLLRNTSRDATIP